PLDARTLARLAGQYAGDQAGTVVGFGLSNDERRGDTADFEKAFQIAARAGLASVPHAGELLGPEHVRDALAHLGPDRLGHGVRAAEEPTLLRTLVQRGVTLEVCPSSNVALGVYDDLADVPLRQFVDSGVGIALGADDPLLFGSRLLAQYESARHDHGLSDEELAELARGSIRGSRAPKDVRAGLLADVEAWLAADEPGKA